MYLHVYIYIHTHKLAQKATVGSSIKYRKVTNLRFADDLLLFAISLDGAQTMLKDLVKEAAKFGLEVHSSKTKLTWNGFGEGTRQTYTEVLGQTYEIVPCDGSILYLGRCFQFSSMHDTELRHRVGKAWAKFNVFRDELTNKIYPLPERLRLFKTVIQPTFLYGCVSWTMTRTREQLVKTTERKMIRKIIGTQRLFVEGQSENWVEWVIRATRIAEEHMRNNNVPDWAEEIHRRKFKWAGEVARRQDGRWSHEVLAWNAQGTRPRKRPHKRWSDSISYFVQQCLGGSTRLSRANGEWIALARDKVAWQALTNDYVNFALGK